MMVLNEGLIDSRKVERGVVLNFNSSRGARLKRNNSHLRAKVSAQPDLGCTHIGITLSQCPLGSDVGHLGKMSHATFSLTN